MKLNNRIRKLKKLQGKDNRRALQKQKRSPLKEEKLNDFGLELAKKIQEFDLSQLKEMEETVYLELSKVNEKIDSINSRNYPDVVATVILTLSLTALMTHIASYPELKEISSVSAITSATCFAGAIPAFLGTSVTEGKIKKFLTLRHENKKSKIFKAQEVIQSAITNKESPEK